MELLRNYESIIDDIEDFVRGEGLKLDEIVQVLYDNQGEIINWYFSDEAEMMFYKEDIYDDEYEADRKKKLKTIYLKDKPYLKEIMVVNLQIELEEKYWLKK